MTDPMPEEDLIATAVGEESGGNPLTGFEGPSFDQSWDPWQAKQIRQATRPIKQWIKAGAPFDPGGFGMALDIADARRKQNEAMAEQIVADRTAFLQVATRVHKIGKSFPHLPADVAYALAMGGFDDASDATQNAADTTGIVSPTEPVRAIGDVPERRQVLTARAALDFSRVNGEMSDAELLSALAKRGWSPDSIQTFVWTGTNFVTRTDESVTADVRSVLEAEADVEDVDDGGSWLGNAAGEVFGVAKGTARWSFGFVSAPWEAFNAAIRANNASFEDGGLSNAEKLLSVAGAYVGVGWNEGWDETSFAEAVRQGVGPGGVDAGTGWFFGGSVEASKSARDYFRYANQIGEEPGTLGRNVTSLVLKPGSEPFRLVSGVVDATGALALDPSSYVPAGAAGKVVRSVPGLRAFTSAREVVRWAGETKTISGVSVADDAVEEALTAAKVQQAPEVVVEFPKAEAMPRMADEAGPVDQWAPRWYAGGSPSQSTVKALLTGGKQSAADAGLRVRSTRRSGGQEPIMVEFDSTGMTGYVDTNPATEWASEITAGRSTNIIPNESVDAVRERMTRIHITEDIDPDHPVSDLLNNLVANEGWNVRVRNIPTRDSSGAITGTRKVTSLYRPDQVMEDGTRVSPFFERVDTETGEIANALRPGSDNLGNALGNWTDAVTGDFSMDTFLTNFGEIRPLRTRELYDRNPLAVVTDAGMLNEIPDEGAFRVMYVTDDLKGGVDDAAGEHQIVQTSYADDPNAAWAKPKQPEDFDEAAELEKATKDFERELNSGKRKAEMEERALDLVYGMEEMAEDGAHTGFIASLSKPDRTRALSTGEVPIEDILNTWSPSESESLARYLTYGPAVEDRVSGIRGESVMSINNNTIDDLLYMVLPREQAEKVLADWRAGKPVRVRTQAQMKTLAQPEQTIVGRVVDDAGNVVDPGRARVKRTQRVGGGKKVTTNIPNINVMGDVQREIMREIGEPEEIVEFARRNHQARVAEWDSIEDAPTLYVAERADVAAKPGHAEAAYPDWRVFPSARTASTKSETMDALAGTRAANAVFKSKKRPARIADLNDDEVRNDVLEVISQEFDALSDRGAKLRQVPEDFLAQLDRLEQAIARADVVESLRAYESAVMLLPESQGQNAARATMHMDMLADYLRAQGFDAVKWTDDAGEDVFEILHTADWKFTKPKRTKVTDRTTLVKESWDSRRFGVKLSAKQDDLYRHMTQIDAPLVRPRNVAPKQWKQWIDQRERMLKRGWTSDETEIGREVLRRPLAGEYDGNLGQSMHKALDEADITPPEAVEAGVTLNATRDAVVPEKFYSWLTTNKRVQVVLEKIARLDSIEDIAKEIGWHQNPEVLARLTRASTKDEVMDVILDATDTRKIRSMKIRGAGQEKVRNVVDAGLYHVPGFRRSLDDVRLLHVMPGQYVPLNDPVASWRQLHNWLINARVPKAKREALMLEMAENVTSWGRKETYFAAFKVIEAQIAESLRKQWRGLKDENEIAAVAREMTTLFRKDLQTHAEYAVKDPGVRGYVAGSQITDQSLVVPGPMKLGDFFDSVLPLPNPREIARATGIVGRMAATGSYRGRALEKVLKVGDGYNSFWKVTALARVAYPVRVLLEEQGRLYGAGLPNIYSHPAQYILHTFKGKRGTDLMGRKWDDLAADPEPNQYAQAMVNAKLLFDNDDSVKFLTKNYTNVGPEDERFLSGWMFGLGKQHADPISRRLVDKWTSDEIAAMPEGMFDDATPQEKVTWWLTSHDTGREYLASMLEATRTSMPDFHAALLQREGVQRWVDELEEHVRYITAQYEPALVEVIRTGTLRAGDKAEPIFINPDAARGGQVWNTTHPNRGGFIDVLRNYTRLEAKPQRVIAPDVVLTKGNLPWYDNTVTFMFSYLNGKPTNYLSRSPVFRERYWEDVATHIRYADDAAVAKLTKQMEDAKITRQQRKAIDKALAQRNPKTSTLTASDVDGLAKADALEFVEDLLYSTADKTHLWDALRIAAPFGNAWAEVLSTWARLAVANPKILDRLAHGVHGAQQQGSNVIYDATGTLHDPEQGFFFKDLETDDESFAWPMPPQLQPLVAAMFPAPVAGLNLIGQVQPGFGPMVTAPAGVLLNQPGWREDVYNFIAPFGGPSAQDAGGVGNAIIDSVTPAWLRKLMTAVYPINSEQKSQLAAATLSSMTYLSSTGKYDMANPEDVQRLQDDANTMARRVFLLRAIGQFVLPTMGSPEQVAKTGNGELVLQTKLSAILRQYQSDPGEGGFGYQQGLLRFLRDYGNELYLMGVDRTDSTGYMAPTRQTYDWMRQHPGLTKRYPDVWGLLVDDPGTEFYYPAYQAQIRRGFRTLINPEDLVGLANDRIGRAIYTSIRAQYPEYPSDTESARLLELQDTLELKYPGYNRIPVSIGEGATRIQQLERASKDSEVQNLPVGRSLSTYFAARTQLKANGISSFRTGEGRELAPQLWQLGETLAAQDPTFAVAWDRLLSTEFDSEQFAVQEAA